MAPDNVIPAKAGIQPRQCHSGEARNPGPRSLSCAQNHAWQDPCRSGRACPREDGQVEPGSLLSSYKPRRSQAGCLWIPAPGLRRGRLRRNDMGWGEHGHSQGGRALPTEMYAGGLICGRGALPDDEHKNLTDTPGWLMTCEAFAGMLHSCPTRAPGTLTPGGTYGGGKVWLPACGAWSAGYWRRDIMS